MEVVGGFHHQNSHRQGIDAQIGENIGAEDLGANAVEDDMDARHLDPGGIAQRYDTDSEALHGIGDEPVNDNIRIDRLAGAVGHLATEAQAQTRPLAGGAAGAHRDRIPDRGQGDIGKAAPHQLAQDNRGIPGHPAARIVPDVGDHHRPGFGGQRPVERVGWRQEFGPGFSAQAEQLQTKPLG